MRIRQVKPGFWADEKTAALVSLDDTALFYIGLWMQADDGGYIKWEPRRIAAELYPYSDTLARESAVLHHKLVLEHAKKLRVYKCGHALIPTLVDHQHFTASYKQNHETENLHKSCSRGAPRQSADSRGVPLRVGKVSKGKVSKARSRAKENGAVTTIEEHDEERSTPLSYEEKVQTWIDLWRNPNSGERATQRAEQELQRLGWRLEGKEWVKA